MSNSGHCCARVIEKHTMTCSYFGQGCKQGLVVHSFMRWLSQLLHAWLPKTFDDIFMHAFRRTTTNDTVFFNKVCGNTPSCFSYLAALCNFKNHSEWLAMDACFQARFYWTRTLHLGSIYILHSTMILFYNGSCLKICVCRLAHYRSLAFESRYVQCGLPSESTGSG